MADHQGLYRKIGLVSIINELVPLKMEIDQGTLVLGVVIDTLSLVEHRSTICTSFFEGKDTALILGKTSNEKLPSQRGKNP